MIVSNQASLLWQEIPADIFERITGLLNDHPTATIFFRADDVAIPSAKQTRLLQTFINNNIPLCPAVVPAWISTARWEAICSVVRNHQHLFAWHQHGWNHLNHQASGKKQEFGSDLPQGRKHAVLLRGRQKLETLLGRYFVPVFTPPWNRVDVETMTTLKELEFIGISRYRDDKLPALSDLPDIPCNVDLHTRKEATSAEGWEALLQELSTALGHGRVGFMIHHQRMNTNAFLFLDRLLELLGRSRNPVMHFGSLFTC